MVGEPVKISVDVDREFHHRMQKALGWGIKARLVRCILEMIVEAVERQGEVIIGAILSGEYRIVYTPKTRPKKGQKR